VSKNRIAAWCFVVTSLCVNATTALSQQASVTELIAAARVAIAKKDCKASAEILESASMSDRQEPLWMYTIAQAYECSRDYAKAIGYYRAYDAKIPGNSEIIDKIGTLIYASKMQSDSLAARERGSYLRSHIQGIWTINGNLRIRIEEPSPKSYVAYSETEALPITKNSILFRFTETGFWSSGEYIHFMDPRNEGCRASHPHETSFNISSDGRLITTGYVDHYERSDCSWFRAGGSVTLQIKRVEP
jgi:hypothetical protein